MNNPELSAAIDRRTWLRVAGAAATAVAYPATVVRNQSPSRLDGAPTFRRSAS